MSILRSHRRIAGVAVGVALTGLVLGAVAVARSVQSTVSHDKQVLIDHQFAAPAGAAAPASKNPLKVVPYDAPTPGVPLQQVTTTDVQVPLPHSIFEPTSQWLNVVNEIQTAVYAGLAPKQAGSGAIYVWISDLNTGSDQAGTGLFPAKVKGPLTITGVTGDTVAFTTASGGQGTFNLTNDSFGG
jgi:hypothetical protein